MRVLKRGDPCPCCGQPIKTKDPDVLRLLSWIADTGRFPSYCEIKGVLDGPAPQATEEGDVK